MAEKRWVSDGRAGYREEDVNQSKDDLVRQGFSPEIAAHAAADHATLYGRPDKKRAGTRVGNIMPNGDVYPGFSNTDVGLEGTQD